MSIKDYKGGIITKNPTTPTGPYQDGAASGVWTMDEAAEYTKQGVWPTAGNISPEQYVDGLLSTYLYTGTGSALDIDNDLDLSGKGGLVWIKNRTNVSDHTLFDTARGPEKLLFTTSTSAEQDRTADNDSLGAFNADGFSLQASTGNRTNESGSDFVSWSFLKKPGFFDVLTYTGDGSVQSINHNLGSVPACMIVKRTDSTGDWYVYHVDLGVGINGRKTVKLNSTAAQSDSGGFSDHPTATAFTVNYAANTSGATYVAYLFASDDARFGDNANESIIKCASYTGNGSTTGPVVNVGFEPQWILIKNTSQVSNWLIHDVMRGMSVGENSIALYPNLTNADTNPGVVRVSPNATGFYLSNTASGDLNTNGNVYIYIAIRRPMKTPTAATEVFTPIARTGTGATAEVTGVGFSPDMLLQGRRTAPDWPTSDRLRGVGKNLGTPYTQAETTPGYIDSYDMDGVTLGSGNAVNGSGLTYIEYFFKRAPGFFDVVAYTGNGSPSNTVRRDLNHNLGVTPELAILKRRDSTSEWQVGVNGTSLYLNLSNGSVGTYTPSSYFNATDFDVEGWITEANNNVSGATYVVYLFATLAGVSKVGSFTHTSGSDTNVDCGFTSGARFVLIKRTDATDGWQVYDTARGINSGADPVLQLNDTAAEFSQDLMDPYSAGFTITGTKTSGTYIFLAIA